MSGSRLGMKLIFFVGYYISHIVSIYQFHHNQTHHVFRFYFSITLRERRENYFIACKLLALASRGFLQPKLKAKGSRNQSTNKNLRIFYI